MHKQLFKSNINSLLSLLRGTSNIPDQLSASIAQYVCVSANGYLEQYMRASLLEKYRNRCDSKAYRIITKSVSNNYNFRHKKIISFIGEYWAENENAVLNYMKFHAEFADALSSIVANKNTIAHEGSSSVSRIRVQQWLQIIFDNTDSFSEICFS